MKKFITICLVCVVVLVIVSLSACSCKHEWQDATCTIAQTCRKCEETQGEALGHNWIDASCIAPRTCSVCEATEGDTIEHTWKEATCETPKTCGVCGKTSGRIIGHISGEWKHIDDMVYASRTSEKHCKVCGEKTEVQIQAIDKLHDGMCFLFTPYEFAERIEFKLSMLVDNEISITSRVMNGDIVSNIMENNDSIGLMLYAKYNGDTVTSSEGDTACIADILCYVEYCESMAKVILSLIETCDPSLSFSEVKDLAMDLVENETITKNGITYVYMLDFDGMVLLGASLN